jgi:RimJ/RimL family protein N-acetyltransferase
VTVLVDECRWPWRDRLWCHLVSDTSVDELHQFAHQLGLPRVAFQGDHYDLHEDGRARAIVTGAVPVDSRVLLLALKAAGLRRGPDYNRRGVAAVAHLPAPELMTDRLILRQWRADDFAFLRELDTDPEVMRLLDGPRTYEQTEKQFNKDAVGLALRGIGKWAVELREGGTLVGRVGLSAVDSLMSFSPALELGWRLSSQHHGKGYATEAARAAITYGFDVLEVDRIAAFTVPHNHASIGVMRKLGMVDAGEFDHPRIDAGNPLRRHVLRWMVRESIV